MVVHPDLHQIDLLVRQLCDISIHFRGGGYFKRNAFHALRRSRISAPASETAARGENARHMGAARALLGAHREDEIAISSHADHRRYAVGSVKLQLLLNVLAR